MSNHTNTQLSEARLEPCPLNHHVSAGLKTYKSGDNPRIVCLDCGLTLAATDWITVYERWHSRSRASVAAPQPTGEWRHVHIPAGNQRVVAIEFETAEQATDFINRFASSPSLKVEEVAAGEQRVCVKCGHEARFSGNPQASIGDGWFGSCTYTDWTKAKPKACGCKCEFPATTPVTSDARAETSR